MLAGYKRKLRDFTARALFSSKITSPSLRGAGRLSIATFHRVLAPIERQAYPFPGIAVTPEELEWFLDFFTRFFTCGNLQGIHKRWLQGEQPERPFLAITFDDGQLDNYVHARLVLARFGVKASFFIPVDAVETGTLLWHDRLGFAVMSLLKSGDKGKQNLNRILAQFSLTADLNGHGIVNNVAECCKKITGSERLRLVEQLTQLANSDPPPPWAALMNWRQVKQLADEGHEIGSHSMTHRMMPQCNDEELEFELHESRRILEQRLTRSVESFCFPNGDANVHTASATQRAGYLRAVTTTWGTNLPTADPFQLRRCDMDANRILNSSGNFSPSLLAWRMSGLYPGLG